MSGFVRRLVGIPWKGITRDAFSDTFLVAQAVCAVHVFNTHVIAHVHGPSMLLTMNLVGEAVAVDKVSMRLGKVAPGAIVVLISLDNPRKTVAKRMLGMEGDFVTYLVDPGNTDVSKIVMVSYVSAGRDKAIDPWI